VVSVVSKDIVVHAVKAVVSMVSMQIINYAAYNGIAVTTAAADLMLLIVETYKQQPCTYTV